MRESSNHFPLWFAANAGSFMSNGGNITAGRNAPLFAWLGPLAGLAELGTEGYPRPARRQMAIVNLMAVLIAIFSAIYAIVFALYGMDVYLHLIVVNLLLVAVALFVPLAHRISDIAGALLIAIAEFAALFYFVRALGHDSGIQTNYIIAAAVAFAICGMTRFRLTVAVIVTGLALHLAAWFLFPPERALIAAPPALLANLYVSSAVTTFGMIALIVGWFATLITGRLPGALHRFLAAYVRYATHVFAFLTLVANQFPGFAGTQGTYPVDVQVAAPERQNRWKTLFRLPLGIPAHLLGSALTLPLELVAFFGWFVGLFLGRMPEGLRNLGAYILRYQAQAYAYSFLLTDSYPYSGPTDYVKPLPPWPGPLPLQSPSA